MQRFQKKRVALSALVLLFPGGFVCTQAIKSQGQSQAELNNAAGRDYKKTDREMNVAYKKLMGVLNAEQKTQLKTAQTAWLKFRDAESDFLASKAKSGTIHPMIHASHLMEITQERTRELKSAYKLFTTEGEM